MPYLYGLADTKFVKKKTIKKRKEVPPAKFHKVSYLAGKPYFNRKDVPLINKTTPATLVELCINTIDKMSICSVYEWGEVEVVRWLANYGYPQYRNAFRANLVTGRKLLLIDSSALSAMNIKDFDHILHITEGIHTLFQFEVAKLQYEIFKLFRTRTGKSYDRLRRSDLWRAMQMVYEKSPSYQHWEFLDIWLKREPIRKYINLIGYVPKFKLYSCAIEHSDPNDMDSVEPAVCTCCIPPCDCNWTKRDIRLPTRLSCLGPGLETARSKWAVNEHICKGCIPPCECRWPSRYYLTGTVIKCLQQKFPEKFCPIFDERIKADPRPSLVERWTRFSF